MERILGATLWYSGLHCIVEWRHTWNLTAVWRQIQSTDCKKKNSISEAWKDLGNYVTLYVYQKVYEVEGGM